MKDKKNLILFLLLVVLLQVNIHLAGAPGKVGNSEIRTIKLKEVLRIEGTDDEGHYFFQWPRNLQTDRSGNVYLLDKEQFLIFDNRGTFRANLFKKGQGPGEVIAISNYFPLPGVNEILLHNPYPNKIIKMSTKGELIEEKRILVNPFLQFFFFDIIKEKYYFVQTQLPDTKGKAIITKEANILFTVSNDKIPDIKGTADLEKLRTFPVSVYAITSKQAMANVHLTKLESCYVKDLLFFFTYTGKYEIELIDLEKNKVIRTISPDYKRVKVTVETKKFLPIGGFVIGEEVYRPPVPDFFNDIQAIFFYDSMLWVFTSTVDPEKGVLVDKWNLEGQLIEQVFLKLAYPASHYGISGSIATIVDGYLYKIEKDTDDNYIIIKYQLPGYK